MIAVGYSLIGLAAFAVGVTAGLRAKRDRQSTNRVDDLADKYWQGYRDGQIRGYGDGYSNGRADLIGEEQAKAIHPTAHPLAEVRSIFDRSPLNTQPLADDHDPDVA